MNSSVFSGPYPVVVVVSRDQSSGVLRASPFTWAVPIDKTGMAIVLMRNISKTLENIKAGCSMVTLSTIRPDRDSAQKILKTCDPSDRQPLELEDHVGWPVKVPRIAASSILSEVIASESHTLSTGYTTVFLKTLDIGGYLASTLVLMHSGGKLFSTPSFFEVEGY